MFENIYCQFHKNKISLINKKEQLKYLKDKYKNKNKYDYKSFYNEYKIFSIYSCQDINNLSNCSYFFLNKEECVEYQIKISDDNFYFAASKTRGQKFCVTYYLDNHSNDFVRNQYKDKIFYDKIYLTININENYTEQANKNYNKIKIMNLLD